MKLMPWTATQVIDRSLHRPQQAPTCGCSGPPVLQRSPSYYYQILFLFLPAATCSGCARRRCTAWGRWCTLRRCTCWAGTKRGEQRLLLFQLLHGLHRVSTEFVLLSKMRNASRICVSSLRRGHANLLCIVPILVYVKPKFHIYTMVINV